MIYKKILIASLIIPSLSLQGMMCYLDKKKDLTQEATEQARASYAHFAGSVNFNPILIKEDGFREQAFAQLRGVQRFTVRGAHGNPFEAMLIDRGSNKVVVIGAGFKQDCKKMLPFLDIFAHYDVVLFDYSSHNERQTLTYLKRWWNTLDEYYIDAQQDVRALVNQVKSIKQYDQVYGFGLCYSGAIFVELNRAAMTVNYFLSLISL